MSGSMLKGLWQAYQERNNRYENMSDVQRQLYLEEQQRIKEHNLAVALRKQRKNKQQEAKHG